MAPVTWQTVVGTVKPFRAKDSPVKSIQMPTVSYFRAYTTGERLNTLPSLFAAYCPMLPEKQRMGSDYVYEFKDEAMSYRNAVKYCVDTHQARLPTIYSRIDTENIQIVLDTAYNCK